MAPLNPPQFSFPPIRYSPIQEAFRGALDIGMSELFQLPFQKLAMKRELSKYAQEQGIERATEVNFMPAKALATRQSEINTGQVIDEETLDPETRSNLQRAGAAPKYSFSGKNYYAPDALIAAKKYGLPVAPNVQSYIDDARKRMGLYDQVGKPVTEGQLPEVATTMGLEKEAADYQLKKTQFEELRVDDLINKLSTPGPEFLEFAQKYAFEQDPEHPGHLTRDFRDSFVVSKMSQYMEALHNPVLLRSENAAYRKQIQEDLNRATQLLPRLRPMSSYIPDRDDIQKRIAAAQSASPSSALTSEVGILARLAAKWGILKDAQGKYVPIRGNEFDMVRGITAIQSDPDLLQAMVYATAYGSLGNMQQGGRVGGPYPTNKKVQDYLRYQVFPAMGGTGGVDPLGIHDPSSPNYDPAASTRETPYGGGGEGPAANEVKPSTPTSGAKPLLVPAGPQQVLGGKPAAGAAPLSQIGMSEGGRALYNGIFTKVKGDPQSFAHIRATMDSIFQGPPSQVLETIKALGRDASLPLSPDDRNQLLLAVYAIERAPAAKRATMISALKYQLISHSVQAREDALGAAMTVKPEATGTGEKPAEKPVEKKPE
jgi:hypothetical protein